MTVPNKLTRRVSSRRTSIPINHLLKRYTCATIMYTIFDCGTNKDVGIFYGVTLYGESWSLLPMQGSRWQKRRLEGGSICTYYSNKYLLIWVICWRPLTTKLKETDRTPTWTQTVLNSIVTLIRVVQNIPSPMVTSSMEMLEKISLVLPREKKLVCGELHPAFSIDWSSGSGFRFVWVARRPSVCRALQGIWADETVVVVCHAS